MRSIVDFIPAGYELKQVTAGEMAGPCPWCGGRDRFHVWPGKGKGGRYWCRGCGRQGDGIQFLRDVEGMGYRDACRAIGATPATPARSGRPVSKRPAASTGLISFESRMCPEPNAAWCRAAGNFLTFAVAAMDRESEGQAYAASRGLRPETVAALAIGWNPSDLYQPRDVWDLPPAWNERGKPKSVWIASGLVIPSFDAAGRVWALKIRRVPCPEGKDKYSQPAGSGQAPFVLLPGKGKPVVIVESELDAVLVAQEAGSLVAAVALRSAGNKPDAATLAIIKAAPVVLIALDRDETGKKGAAWWLANFTTAFRWMVPSGHKDVGDLAKRPGLVRAWIEAGLRATR